MPRRNTAAGNEEKAVMRAIARASLRAALDNPVDGLVLAKWEDYQKKVNLKEELVLVLNIKDFKTIASQITGINFYDAHYPKLLKETLEQFELNEKDEIISCFSQKKINVEGETGTIWQKKIKQGVSWQNTGLCIFKAPVPGTNWVEKNIIDNTLITDLFQSVFPTFDYVYFNPGCLREWKRDYDIEDIQTYIKRKINYNCDTVYENYKKQIGVYLRLDAREIKDCKIFVEFDKKNETILYLFVLLPPTNGTFKCGNINGRNNYVTEHNFVNDVALGLCYCIQRSSNDFLKFHEICFHPKCSSQCAKDNTEFRDHVIEKTLEKEAMQHIYNDFDNLLYIFYKEQKMYEIKESTRINTGEGVFATQNMPIGTIIGNYRGPVVASAKTQKELESKVEKMNNDKLWTREPQNEGDDYEAIDGNFTDMAKIQDYRPVKEDWNAEICKDATIIAIQDISKGVEIFIDYGEWYWDNLSAKSTPSQASQFDAVDSKDHDAQSHGSDSDYVNADMSE